MSYMRKLALAPVALVTLVALTTLACGGTDEPNIESVSGLWTATRFEYVSVADATVKVDIIAQGGSATLNLNDNGQYAATVTPPGAAPETTTGAWSYTMDTLTLTGTGGKSDLTFDMSVGNDTMTLAGADVEYDFNDDGTDEPAKLNISLVR